MKNTVQRYSFFGCKQAKRGEKYVKQHKIVHKTKGKQKLRPVLSYEVGIFWGTLNKFNMSPNGETFFLENEANVVIL